MLILTKHSFSTYRINYSITVRRWEDHVCIELWWGIEQMITRPEATKYE